MLTTTISSNLYFGTVVLKEFLHKKSPSDEGGGTVQP